MAKSTRVSRICRILLLVLPFGIALAPSGAAFAATFIVTSTADEGDFDGGDGLCATEGGVCTWAAAQQEVQGSIHKSFLIQFHPAVVAVPAGRFAATSGGLGIDITIEGPIVVDMSLAPVRSRGLHFEHIDTIHLKEVWIKGAGDYVGGFDLADTGFVSSTLNHSSCIIESSRVTGVHEPLNLGGTTTPIHCLLLDNVFGFAEDGTPVGNGHGLELYGDGWTFSGNVLAGSQSGHALETWGDGNTITDNQFGAMGPVDFPNAGGLYVLGDDSAFYSNVVSSRSTGMELRGDRNSVTRLRIGTDVTGTIPMGNTSGGLRIIGDDNCIGSYRGIVLDGCNPQIGLDEPDDVNVIANSGADGIYILGKRNVLSWNVVGTDLPSENRMPNFGHGIYLRSGADTTTILGGTVSSNVKSGIYVDRSEDTRIYDVIIGTSAMGSETLGNGEHGIHLLSSLNTEIGNALDEATGNEIAGNFGDGIRVEGANGTVQGVTINHNFIGLAPTAESVPNWGNGITIFNSVFGLDIFDNVISGNTNHGIQIRSDEEDFSSKSRSIDIMRNYIGTGPATEDPTTQALETRSNGGAGIHLTDVSASLIRHPYNIDIGAPKTPADSFGNVIAGNGGPGVWVEYADEAIRVQGNYIGVDPSMHKIPNNGDAGVLIGKGAENVLVGGLNVVDAEAGNVISGNLRDGIRVSGFGPTIQGNWIGTDAEGRVRGAANAWLGLGNGRDGISLSGSDFFEIGGEIDAANVISGNGALGIRLWFSDDGLVSHNSIGVATPAAGFDQDLGNWSTGLLGFKAAGNQVSLNDIGFNLGSGVHFTGATADLNWITENSIHDNSRKGIKISHGANEGIDPPIHTTVSLAQVEGMTCPGCTVEVFSDEGDEGRIFEGRVVADGTGQFVLAKVFAGPVISCTTFDSDKNTSEFGCESVDPPLLEFLTIQKRVLDPNEELVAPGDRLTYELEILNATVHDFQDEALFDEVKDILPEHTTYVAESLTVGGIANDDDLADGAGFDVDANAVVWNGNLPSGIDLSIAFQVDVDGDTAIDTLISNQAQLTVASNTLAPLATALLSDDPDSLELGDPTDVIVGLPVPEPHTALLRLAALLTVVAVRRRQQCRPDRDRYGIAARRTSAQ